MPNESSNTPQAIYDQRGQILQGDQINVAGDIILNRLDPADARVQRNHAALRQMVRAFWIDGVFKRSLYNEVLIRLNLENRSDLVDNRPWNLILHRPDLVDESVSSSAPIIDTFDQMGQRLLILGEPGSGKTTMLLELADALLNRAENNPTHPTPVVFNLSSWSPHHKLLADWLVIELHEKYNIPQQMAQTWVAQDALLPLLDGLDEVQETHRLACAEAINVFRQTHLTPLAVCCRRAEYENLQKRLKLQGAVLVHPLHEQQIDAYLHQFGDTMHQVRLLLQQDDELRNLSTSPLDLSVIMLAYAGGNLHGLTPGQDRASVRAWLFNAYIQRLLEHRGPIALYTTQQILTWLHWLACQMLAQGKSSFLLEQLQPTQLTESRQHFLYQSIIRLTGVVLFLTACILIGSIAGIVSPISTLSTGLQVGLRFGLSLSLALVVASILGHWMHGLLAMLMTLAMMIATLRLTVAPQLSYAIVDTILFGLPGCIAGLTLSGKHAIRPVAPLTWSRLKLGIALGLLGTGLLTFAIAAMNSLESGLSNGLIVGCCLLPVLIFSTSGTQEIKTSISPNQGIRNSLYSALRIFALMTTIGILIGIAWGVLKPSENFGTGLAFGLAVSLPIGLVAASAGGGATYMQHYLLRTVLVSQGVMPWRYRRFLDYATDRLFLRRVGGEYFFYHRLLLEHLANTQETNNGNR